jgi:putative transposase
MAQAARQDPGGAGARDGCDRAREIGLFRYALIREAADTALSSRQRGRLVRELAAVEHAGPFGARVRVSRVTIDRWILAWRRGGFDALVPSARAAEPRTTAAVLELAAALKREVPARTAAQVAAILAASTGTAPSARTLQRHFVRLELNTRPDGTPPRSFGRFEAAERNDLWTGDALHGPVVGGRKSYLFAFIDDHCAPRGASLYPRCSRDELGGRFLGLMAYLDPKGEGDNSMPGKQRPCPGVRNGALRDPRDMAEAGLPAPQSPGDVSSTSAGKTPDTGAMSCIGIEWWPVQPPGRGAMPNKGIQGDEWGA